MIIYAHRGYKKKENTTKSFLNSFPYFDGIEFDVRLTKDKIPVVIHDYNLLRTHGVDKSIHLTNYNSLKQYRLPLLDDVLQLVKENKKKCLIDIKVKENSQFIINYLQNLCLQKVFNEQMFKCIVYTNNIVIPKKIEVIRAYKYIIPRNVDIRFSGISVKIDDAQNTQYEKYIKRHLESKFHINIYLQQISTGNSKNFIKYLIDNFNNKLSLTSDKKIDYILV